MKYRYKRNWILFSVLLCILILSFGPALADNNNYAGKKILHVDSYHQGYEWSNGISDGLRMVLHKTEAEVATIYMDTKRLNSITDLQNAAAKAKTAIEQYKPDVVIASDDNASKYLVMKYYRNADLPFVFCGVNWDETIYGYPYKNATGVVEEDLVWQLIGNFNKYAKGDRIGYLAADAPTERKIANIYNKLFFKGRMKTYFAQDFAELKRLFLQAQDENDQLYFSNNAGISDWDSDEAKAFFRETTRIPTGSHNAWMCDYVLFTVAKLPEEQGLLAGKIALEILDGTPPDKINVVKNKLCSLAVNMSIGRPMGVVLDLKQLINAQIIR